MHKYRPKKSRLLDEMGNIIHPKTMKDALKNYFSNSGYKLVLLFGSYAKGTQKPSSDLDIGIFANEKLTNEQLVQISTDLSAQFSLEADIIDLRMANFMLLEEIFNQHEILINNDSSILPNLVSKMLKDKEDLGTSINHELNRKIKGFLKK